MGVSHTTSNSSLFLNGSQQEVGYHGEIGYQTFLYSNEAEIRKLFMFLVENLPKESSESASEPLGKYLSLFNILTGFSDPNVLFDMPYRFICNAKQKDII